MIERVARAIADKMEVDWRNPPTVKPSLRMINNMARAAIAAMREPSDKMLDAVGVRYNRGNKKYFWQAMIDAALEEK